MSNKLTAEQLEIFDDFFENFLDAKEVLNRGDLENLYRLVCVDKAETFATSFKCVTDIIANYLTKLLMSAGIDVIGYFIKQKEMPVGCFYDCDAIDNDKVNKLIANKEVIPSHCFGRCNNITNVKMSSNTRIIDSEAFYQCKELVDIDLCSVTQLRSRCFNGCESLTKLNIPISVDLIEQGALGYSATDIYYGGKKADWERIQKARGSKIFQENGFMSGIATIHTKSGDIYYKSR